MGLVRMRWQGVVRPSCLWPRLTTQDQKLLHAPTPLSVLLGTRDNITHGAHLVVRVTRISQLHAQPRHGVRTKRGAAALELVDESVHLRQQAGSRGPGQQQRAARASLGRQQRGGSSRWSNELHHHLRPPALQATPGKQPAQEQRAASVSSNGSRSTNLAVVGCWLAQSRLQRINFGGRVLEIELHHLGYKIWVAVILHFVDTGSEGGSVCMLLHDA